MKEMNKRTSFLLIFSLTLLLAFVFTTTSECASGGPPANYYDNAEGKTGTDLKLALHNIIDGQDMQSYDSLYDHFKQTDKRPDGTAWCMYSGWHFESFSYEQPNDKSGGEIGAHLTREHSWPKSWWGGSTSTPAYTDLFILYPADGWINSIRSNYPYGEVGSDNENYGISYRGYPRPDLGYSNDYVFEVADNYKGDFARSYFYFAVRYLTGSGALDCSSSPMIKSNGTEFENWALDMLTEWHEGDPVDDPEMPTDKEINRNEEVYEVQNNRNPFIDHPEWVYAIWYPEEYSVGASVSVSPSEDNAPPGHELDYEVTVTNTGSSTDNYDLAVTDNAGWSPTLDESLFENVESGESRKTTLRVTIPEGTEIGTQDNITVTTTSQESTQVSDNESCIAISAPLLRSVETSASPGSKEGSPGSNLKYSITVTNTGNVTDNYDLTANNDENWNLSLGKNSVKNVSSGGENTTTLTVEIPDNADLIGLTNTIIVTAVSQENSSVNDSGTSTAKVVEEPVGGIFHPADRERLEEQGEKALTAFVIPLVILFGIITFSVWWRKRE